MKFISFLCVVVLVAVRDACGKSLIRDNNCWESMLQCNPLYGFNTEDFDVNNMTPWFNRLCSYTLNTQIPCYNEWAGRCLTNGTAHNIYSGSVTYTQQFCTDPNAISLLQNVNECSIKIMQDPVAYQEWMACNQQALNSIPMQQFISLFISPNPNWTSITAAVDSPAAKSFLCCSVVNGRFCGLKNVQRICGQASFELQLQEMTNQLNHLQCSLPDLDSCTIY